MIDQSISESWRDQIILSAEIRDAAQRRAFYRRAGRGEFVRLSLGAYTERERWAALQSEQQHLMLCRAVGLTHAGVVFSHLSAAVIRGLPIVARLGTRVDTVEDRADGGRSDGVIRRHCLGKPSEVDILDGLRVTTEARTVVDLAAQRDRAQALVVADHVLHRAGEAGRRRLFDELDGISTRPGRTRAKSVLEFASTDSESPGESISRLVIERLGMPAPQLQHEFFDDSGQVGRVDFWWPYWGVVGEFDGSGKYLRADIRSDRSAAEIVLAEKRREDRLRAHPEVRGLARWEWAHLWAPQELRARLLAAGVRAS